MTLHALAGLLALTSLRVRRGFCRVWSSHDPSPQLFDKLNNFSTLRYERIIKMQIIDTRSGTRQVYELPTPAELKNWPRQEYLKLHRAFCELFSIPVPTTRS